MPFSEFILAGNTGIQQLKKEQDEKKKYFKV